MGIESAKLKKKLSDINFSGLDFTKEQQEQIANLSKLNEKGKYEIEFKDKTGESVVKQLDALKGSESEIKKFLEKQTDESGKTDEEKMISLAEQQLGKADQMIATLNRINMAPQLALAGGKGGEKLLDTAFEKYQSNRDFAKNTVSFDKLQPEMNEFAESLNEVVDIISSGEEGSVLQGMKKLAKTLEETTAKVGGVSLDALNDKINNFVKIDLNNLFENVGKSEDFIWRPGEGINKFPKDELVIGGTALMSKTSNTPITENQKQVQSVIETKNQTINNSEVKLGGEVVFKVSLDSNGNLGNLGMNEATALGNRIADAIKSSPDLQNKIKTYLEFAKV